jgi:parvulin-like peptidyl-prolyl isomerase
MMSFTQGVVGKTILASIVTLIIVVFVIQFRTGSGSSTASLQRECVVELGGECLDAKDYFSAYGLIARGASPKASRQFSLKRRTLDGLAERELLYAEAKRLGLGASDEVLDQELSAGRAHVSLPAADLDELAVTLGLCRLEGGRMCEPGTPKGIRQLRVRRTAEEPFDYKLYEREIRILANRGPKEFRATQEKELVAERLRSLVRSRARVSEAEALSVYERGRSRAVVRSVVIEASWFGKYAVDTSAAAVERWAGTHGVDVDAAWKAGQQGFTAGCPVVREITLELSPFSGDTEKTALRERLKTLRERIEKGEAFDAVAREASNAPTAAFGGLVGCLNAGYGPGADVLVAAAGKLSTGAMSDVLETPGGLHLLKLEGKLDASALERDGKAQVTRALYLAAAQRDAASAFAAEVINQTKAGGKLEEVTRALTDELARRGKKSEKPAAGKDTPDVPALLAQDRPRFEISAPFTISGNPLPDVRPREPLAARAFELDKPDAVADRPVETETGLVVLQLKEKTPVSKEDFEKERYALMRVLTDAKASEALTRYVADLRRAAGNKLKVDARYAEESKADSNE